MGDRLEWRRWLYENHATSKGVWLILSKVAGEVTQLKYEEALDEAICFGWIDGQIAKRDEQCYARRFTPRNSKSRWSAKNVENAERLIALGQVHASGLLQIEAAKGDGRWGNAYLGQAKVSTPSDLVEALTQNPKAAKAFEQLLASDRYSIIYRLDAVKSPVTRSKKISWYIEALSRGETIRPKRAKKNSP